MTASESGADGEDGRLTRQQWKWTILASLADYLDAGGIVAGSAGLAVWASAYDISAGTVGVLGAVGMNALSYAFGALIGGRFGDLFGRKRIYQWDLLIYAFGALWMIFSQGLPMLLTGSIIMGLAIGADVPTSWALIGELAPRRARGKLMGLTSVFWSIGPVVTLVLAFGLAPYGLLGIRVVFTQLLLVAVVTWFLRRGMVESKRWTAAAHRETPAPGSAGESSQEPATLSPVPQNPFAMSKLRWLFTKKNVTALLFVFGVHMLGSITGGAYGAFLPYILRTTGSESQAASVGLQTLNFAITAVVVAFVFMPLVDRVNRRVLYAVGTGLVVISLIIFVVFPLTFPVALVSIIIFAIGGGFWQEQFYRVWSQELFPTMLRSTAQGMIIAAQKLLLAVWSLFIPVLASTGFHTLALVFAIASALCLVLGVVFMPNTSGKSLEAIEEERGVRRATHA